MIMTGNIFFLSRFSFTDTDDSQDSRGREGTIFIPLYHFHPLTNRHLFATLHVRWLSHIFNRTACIYQAATPWYLPPYRITIWLNDDVILVFVCLRDDLIQAFLLQFETGNRWTRTRINYHPVLQANRLTKCASHPNIYYFLLRCFLIFTYGFLWTNFLT